MSACMRNVGMGKKKFPIKERKEEEGGRERERERSLFTADTDLVECN
jgi:hypothetical protein